MSGVYRHAKRAQEELREIRFDLMALQGQIEEGEETEAHRERFVLLTLKLERVTAVAVAQTEEWRNAVNERRAAAEAN